MFHLVFSIASRLLCLGNILQGFARGMRALGNLHSISSQLIPALPPPPPILLLDPPTAFADFQDEFIFPNASAELFPVESQSRVFSSLVPRFPSALIAVTPSQLPNLVFFFFMLAIISGSLVLLSEIYVMNAFTISSKPLKARPKANAESHRFRAGLPSRRFSLMSLGSMLLYFTGQVSAQMTFLVLILIGLVAYHYLSRPHHLDHIYPHFARRSPEHSTSIPSTKHMMGSNV